MLKPGGTFVISTRSKEPKYDDLYWYCALAPKAVAAMSERVPSREECRLAMEEAGFEITQCVTPKYASIMNKKHYYDPAGVFSEAWRRGESWWSLVSPEELASLQSEMKKKIEEGTADVRRPQPLLHAVPLCDSCCCVCAVDSTYCGTCQHFFSLSLSNTHIIRM